MTGTTNPVTFEDIVNKIKENPKININKLAFSLGCSEVTIYRRLLSNNYDGVTDLKRDIKNGNI